ncbi:zinc ribbon domain-containing protein [Nocardioides luteus]|uniref:zinc ribbon domain-containing protein n=1 Tax=Nocardioides luteus TaxID=1844 RepID=UPI000A609F4F|nr:zinc ribbon domain-containing protein [Nocardioides luteus]
MALVTAEDCRKSLDNRAVRLERLVKEGEALHAKGQLTLRNLDALRESALLDLYTSFELFLEDLFFAVLLGSSGISDSGGVVNFSDREQAEEILTGGNQYLIWLPFDKNGKGVLPLAKRLLKDGRPFTRIERHKDELDTLEELRIVRNAIAHRSSSARAALEPFVTHLRQRRRTAAGLLEQVRQGQSQYESYSATVRQIGVALASAEDALARKFLSPERPYAPKANAPTGRYRCTRCAKRHQIRAKTAALPACPVCRKGRAKGQPKVAQEWDRVYA